MSESRLVSYIIPTTLSPNRMQYLSETCNSLLAHQKADIQLIIGVDGADPDSVPRWIANDSRTKIVAIPEWQGAAGTRNYIINEADGDWIRAGDDDDPLPPQSLDRQLEMADLYPEAWWIAGYSADLYGDGTTRKWICSTRPGWNDPGDVWRTWHHPKDTVPIGPTTLLVRTSLMRAAGYLALKNCEDHTMSMGVTGLKPGFMMDPSEPEIYWYRKHEDQMTQGPQYDILEPEGRKIAWERGKALADMARLSSHLHIAPVV